MDRGYQIIIVNVLKSEGFREIEGYGETEDAYLVDSFIIEAPWQIWQYYKLELVLSNLYELRDRTQSSCCFVYVNGHIIKKDDFVKDFWEKSNLIFNKSLVFDLFFQERKFLKRWKNVVISGITQNMGVFDIKIVSKKKEKSTKKSIFFDVLEAEQSPLRTYVTFPVLKFAKFIVIIETVDFWKMKEILKEKRKELAEKTKILWKYLKAKVEKQMERVKELMKKEWELKEKIKDLEIKMKVLESEAVDEILKFMRKAFVRFADKIGAKEVLPYLIIAPYEDLSNYTIKTISPFLVLGKEDDFKTYDFLILTGRHKIYGKPWYSKKLYKFYKQPIELCDFVIAVNNKDFGIIQKEPFWILGKKADFIVYGIKIEEKNV